MKRTANDNEVLFAEREQLFINELNRQLSNRHSCAVLRQHIHQHVQALRTIRGARADYNEAIMLAARRAARTPRTEVLMTRH